MMNPYEFKWAVFLLRRRAMEGEGGLWELVNDAEHLIAGQPTNLPREQVVTEVERMVAA
jgi:hypothetical protein